MNYHISIYLHGHGILRGILRVENFEYSVDKSRKDYGAN